jgi:small nuclear ribonucleoprotein (snRNP)-like protein
MEKIVVDAYKLDRISSRMAKNHGTIPRGREEDYAFQLAVMEGNLLKLHRGNSNRTGRHALTAIKMALLTVDGYLRKVEYDYERFVTPENQVFLHGLLMSFDAYTNMEIHEVIEERGVDFNLEKHFVTVIKCLLRIEKSVKLWTDKLGPNGYFDFIEKNMGHMVDHNKEMNYSVIVEEGTSLKR